MNDVSKEIWPACYILNEYLKSIKLKSKIVLELGCGVGLPSKLLASQGNKVFSQDRVDNISCSKHEEIVFIRHDWHTMEPKSLLEKLPKNLDYIFGSDLFYEEEGYSRLMFLVSHLLSELKAVSFISVVHQRNIYDSIAEDLLTLNLQSELIFHSEPFILFEIRANTSDLLEVHYEDGFLPSESAVEMRSRA